MFEAIRIAQCLTTVLSTLRTIPRRSSLWEELELWYGLTENSQEGMWCLAKHCAVKLTWAASDASAIACGDVLT